MTQEERKIKAKKMMLSAAEKQLSRDGIEKTDIEKICQKAGLTKGAFYHHFGSKQQFLLELLDKWIQELEAEIGNAKFDSMDTLDILAKIIDRMQPAFLKAGKQLPVFLELYIKAITDNQLRQHALKSYNNFIKFFSHILSAGIKNGTIKKQIDPDTASKTLFAIAIGLLIQGLLNPDLTDWGVLAKKSLKMLLG